MPLLASTVASQSVKFSEQSGRVFPAQMANIPREVDVASEDHQSNANSMASSNVCADWFEQCLRKGRMGSESMLGVDLVSYAHTTLFPELQFLMDQRQQNFSTAEDGICFWICCDLGLKENHAAAFGESWVNTKLYRLWTVNEHQMWQQQFNAFSWVSYLWCSALHYACHSYCICW
jgi:hypothetical protein